MENEDDGIAPTLRLGIGTPTEITLSALQLDTAIQRLNRTAADGEARRALVGIYHNLMRRWSDT